jgi:signal transduction histidine kinase
MDQPQRNPHDDSQPPFVDPATLDASSDLQTVLAAWHTATVQLERTHNALREEVCRLTQELESKNKELARKNRLADLGRMASHVAHEVRNSLVPVTLYLSLLRRRTQEDAQSVGILDKLEAGFTALEATVHDLLHFTSEHDPKRSGFPVGSLLHEVCDALTPQFAAQEIDAAVIDCGGLEVVADRGMLRRALLNLTLNAVDAMPRGGRLTLAAEETPRTVRLSVADSGPGVPEENRRIFEPFVTGKSGGTGLGLAIVERIAEAHGGTATAKNGPQGGATFTLELPRVSSKKAA